MLQREISSITAAVAGKYQEIRTTSAKTVADAREAAVTPFRMDPRYLNLRDSLKAAGVIDAEGQAWRIVNNGMAATGVGSLAADIKAAVAKIPDTTVPPWNSTPMASELSIALATSTKKWAALQPAVYVLVAALGSAKTPEELADAIRLFTRAIA